MIVLLAIGLLVAANQHGKPRDNWNFWVQLFNTAITVGLLMWGGFF